MLGINVVVLRKDDPGPALPDIPDEGTIELQIEDFVILEAGMSSGRTSVTLHMVDDEGKHYIAQTSAKLFNDMYHSLQGVMAAFNEKEE